MSDAIEYFFQFVALIVTLFLIFSTLVGLLRSWLGQERLRSFLAAGRIRGYAAALALGSVSPFCACSTIPLVRGFVAARAPFGPTVAFMLASPVLNLAMLGVFGVLFGPEVIAIYVPLMLVFALATALAWDRLGFERFVRTGQSTEQVSVPDGPKVESTSEPDCSTSCCDAGQFDDVQTGSNTSTFEGPLRGAWQSHDEPMVVSGSESACSTSCGAAAQSEAAMDGANTPSLKMRLRGASQFGVEELRRALPYILAGALIASLLRGFVPEDWIAAVASSGRWYAVPIASVMGAPLYLTTESAGVIGYSLLLQGAGIGTVMALIVGGASTSIPELLLLRRIFRTRLLAIYIVTSLTVAILTGFAFNALL